MISLDEIQLLEQKIEVVVTKFLQVTEENKSLIQRCSQLESENQSLMDKLSSFEQDQEKIEQGIIKALDRLNVVENSVLQAVSAGKVEFSATDETVEQNEQAILQANSEADFTSGDEGVQHSQRQDDVFDFPPVPSTEEIINENTPVNDEYNERKQENLPLIDEDLNQNVYAENQDYNSGQLDIF